MSANTQGSVMSAAMRNTMLRVSFIAAALTGPVAAEASAQDLRTLLDLRGRWAFEIGDSPEWAKPQFQDADWTMIRVPGAWEDQGFPGYDGIGWYRKWFHMPANWKGKRLYLELGYVDDADEVYLNGHFIAFQGAFPPNFVTRYNVARQYAIPLYALQPDADNLIAVRVYDDQMAGGITHGNIRLVEDQNPLQVDQSLEGIWKLHKGDDMAWKEPLIDERGWIGAQVPSFWETQGLYGHDGFAWYRKTFTVDPKLESEKLILFMGKIDDFDEVYLNGQRVGRSGTFHSDGTAEGGDDVFKQWRAYTLPVGAVKSGTNVIAVRVYDKYYHGGIYEGPIGLVRRSTYANWQPRKTIENRWQSPWRFLEWLFN